MVPAMVPVESVPPDVPTRREANGLASIKPTTDKFPLTITFPKNSAVPAACIFTADNPSNFNMFKPAEPDSFMSGNVKVLVRDTGPKNTEFC